MIELSLQTAETAQIGIAGDTYNTAVYLAHLLKGRAEVHYVTVLGQDAFSDRILAHMQTHGIAQDCVARHIPQKHLRFMQSNQMIRAKGGLAIGDLTVPHAPYLDPNAQ